MARVQGGGAVVVGHDPGAGESDGVVAVLALVRRDHDRRIVGRAFDAFLHGAFAICAAVVAPEK